MTAACVVVRFPESYKVSIDDSGIASKGNASITPLTIGGWNVHVFA